MINGVCPEIVLPTNQNHANSFSTLYSIDISTIIILSLSQSVFHILCSWNALCRLLLLVIVLFTMQ